MAEANINNKISVFIINPYGAEMTDKVRELIVSDVFGDKYGSGVSFDFYDGENCLNPDFLLDHIKPEHSILVFTWLDKNDGLNFSYADREEDLQEFVDFVRPRQSFYDGTMDFVWNLAMEFYDNSEKVRA